MANSISFQKNRLPWPGQHSKWLAPKPMAGLRPFRLLTGLCVTSPPAVLSILPPLLLLFLFFVLDSPSAPVVLSEELTVTELPDEEERAQGWAKVEALLAGVPDPSTLVLEEPLVAPIMPGSSSPVVRSLMGSMYQALNDTNEQLNKATSMLGKGMKLLADANRSIAVLNDTYDTLEEYLHSS